MKSFWSIGGKAALSYILLLALVSAVYGLSGCEAHRNPASLSLEAPSWAHPLGTDDLGMDLLAQLVHGAGVSLLVGAGTALLAGLGGTLLGMAAAYFGGKPDLVFLALCDFFMGLPQLPLMIVAGAFFGPDTGRIVLILSLLAWVGPARIARSRSRVLMKEPFVLASRSYGGGFAHIAFRHFLPHLAPLVSAAVMRVVGMAVIAEAGLSYLGLGDPLSKSWGIILNRAMAFPGIYFTPFWIWWILPPLAALILFSLAIGALGRDLERKFNGKL